MRQTCRIHLVTLHGSGYGLLSRVGIGGGYICSALQPVIMPTAVARQILL